MEYWTEIRRQKSARSQKWERILTTTDQREIECQRQPHVGEHSESNHTKKTRMEAKAEN